MVTLRFHFTNQFCYWSELGHGEQTVCLWIYFPRGNSVSKTSKIFQNVLLLSKWNNRNPEQNTSFLLNLAQCHFCDLLSGIHSHFPHFVKCCVTCLHYITPAPFSFQLHQNSVEDSYLHVCGCLCTQHNAISHSQGSLSLQCAPDTKF